ncbi:MAG: tyrosine-type recombinase/integrase [Ruminococcus sp.]|nr:tyrosine-type recombinase/integrase [Ruminococcus sp.]
MKIFLKYVNKTEQLSFLLDEIKLPRVPKKVVYILTDEEIALVFSSIKSVAPWLTARNKACVALMLDSGIRQGELCSLLRRDVSFNAQNMKVRGKGSKERIVPLGASSIRLVKEYIALCPHKIDNHLFVNDIGKPMTGNAVRQFMERIAAHLPFEFSSHRLRHNFATNFLLDMYEHTGYLDGYQLMVILGHTDMKVTQVYIHAAQEIIASRASFSHLDKLGIIS